MSEPVEVVDVYSPAFVDWIGAPKFEHQAIIKNYKTQYAVHQHQLSDVQTILNDVGTNIIAKCGKLDGYKQKVAALEREINIDRQTFDNCKNSAEETASQRDLLTMKYRVSNRTNDGIVADGNGSGIVSMLTHNTKY